MLPQTSPSSIQRTKPGRRGTRLPSSSLMRPREWRSLSRKASGSAAMARSCAALTSCALSGDQPPASARA